MYSYAFLSAMNRSCDPSSGFLSGWHCSASAWKRFRTSSSESLVDTPSTSHASSYSVLIVP